MLQRAHALGFGERIVEPVMADDVVQSPAPAHPQGHVSATIRDHYESHTPGRVAAVLRRA